MKVTRPVLPRGGEAHALRRPCGTVMDGRCSCSAIKACAEADRGSVASVTHPVASTGSPHIRYGTELNKHWKSTAARHGRPTKARRTQHHWMNFFFSLFLGTYQINREADVGGRGLLPGDGSVAEVRGLGRGTERAKRDKKQERPHGWFFG